ncbi:MAG: CHASE domain-containing protein, partial [Kangiellaceae bacterium]|nr:CHASE domain-containing protein [Kangiellaceae bacterium]
MRARNLSRVFFSPSVAFFAGLVITILFAWSRYYQEYEFAKHRFERHAMVYANAIERQFENNRLVVEDVAAFFLASDNVRREDFRTFTTPKLERYSSIQALEWVPKVPHSLRQEYEAEARRYYKDFRFTERDPSGNLVESAEHPFYYPVYYVEPFKGNEKALGYTPMNMPLRNEVIEQATNSGKTSASKRVHLIQDRQQQYGFLLFTPIFDQNASKDLGNFERLEGLILGVFKIGDVVEAAIAGQQKFSLNVLLQDNTASLADSFLYYHSATGNHLFQLSKAFDARSHLYYDVNFDSLQRQWNIRITPQRGEYLANLALVYTIFAIGLLATFVLTWKVYRWNLKNYLEQESLFKSVRRKTTKLNSKEAALQKHNKALTDLTCNFHLSNDDLQKALEEIAKTVAHTLSVERVSVWLLSGDKRVIHCLELYEVSNNSHTAGVELRQDDYPNYFKALQSGELIEANDALSHPWTAEFIDNYLNPLNIKSMLDVPIRHKGEVIGVVCIEQTQTQRDWTSEEIHFATAVVNYVCLAKESIERRQAEIKVRQTSDRLAVINGIASSIKAGMTTSEVIKITVERLAHRFNDYRVSYSTIDKDGILKVLACTAPEFMPNIEGLEADLSIAPIYLNRLQRQSIVAVTDVGADDRFEALRQAMLAGNTVAVLDVPLGHFDDLVGLICLDSATRHHWQENEIVTLSEVAEFLELAIREAKGQEARRLAEEALEKQKINLEKLVKERTAQLEHKANIEMMVATLSTKFINLPIEDYDLGIYEALKCVGDFCNAERSAFVEILDDQKTAIKNQQWLRDGVESFIPKRVNFDMTEFPWIYEELINKRVVNFSDVNNMPVEAVEDEKKILEMQTQSLALVPII